ncbi:MAG: alpha/beta hydrolase [Cytophagales bacterium]|nr:alpha/beta hydrolase [Cytophagales bacterium]
MGGIYQQKIKIYAFAGLGADKWLFQYQQKDFDLEVLEWREPKKEENLKEYASSYISKIDTSKPFILMGVSFGGILATELSHIIIPHKTILISSASTIYELPFFRKYFQYLPLSFIPSSLFTKLGFLVRPLFSIQTKSHKKLFTKMLNNMPPNFMKWALLQVVHWKREENDFGQLVRIHGTRDLVIPLQGKCDYTIKKGGHLMVMENMKEVNEVLKKIIFS